MNTFAAEGQAQVSFDSGGPLTLSNNAYSASGATLTLAGALSTSDGSVILPDGTLVFSGTLSPATLAPIPSSWTIVLSGTVTSANGVSTPLDGSFVLDGTVTASNTSSTLLNGSSYEHLLDANDGGAGIYFYDFGSDTWFYTSPAYSYLYLYDFTRNAVLYFTRARPTRVISMTSARAKSLRSSARTARGTDRHSRRRPTDEPAGAGSSLAFAVCKR